MNRRVLEASLTALLAAFSFGCGAGRPVRYYVLDTPPAPAVNPSAVYPVSLLVARPSGSHLYRDDRLIYGTGPVQLGTYEYERWSETPVDMVQDILMSALRSGGQYRSVSRLSSNARGDYILRSHIYSISEVDTFEKGKKTDISARVSLQMELYDPATRAIIWSDSYTHDDPVSGKTVQDVVLALDHNIASGVHELTANLGQFFANRVPAQAKSGN